MKPILGVGRREEVRRARVENERDLARLHAHETADARALETEMRRRAPQPHLALGACLPEVPLRLPLTDLLAGSHAWITGSTGARKTTLLIALLAMFLERLLAGARVALIVKALQGDLVSLFLAVLGALLQRVTARRRDEVLSRTTVVRFWQGDYLPPWNLFARDPNVPLLAQAGSTAEVLMHAFGTALGHRGQPATAKLIALMIELGLPPIALRVLLPRPRALADLARKSRDPLVGDYVVNGFPRESPTTIGGIASLFDRLAAVDDSLRGALVGPGTLPFQDAFTPGSITLLDYSGGLLGADAPRRALSALALRSLLAAATSPRRRIGGGTIFAIDEVQLALTPSTAALLNDALTTIRHARVGLYFANQSLAQVPDTFRTLASTNVRYRWVGRSGATDAALSQEFLPRTGRVPKPAAPFAPPEERASYLSRSEEDAHWVRVCGALPPGQFFFTERGTPFGPRRYVAPTFRAPAWESLPADLRDALERGASGVRRATLVERGREAEVEFIRRFSERNDEDTGGGRGRGRGAAPETPDAVARATRWSRRKGGA